MSFEDLESGRRSLLNSRNGRIINEYPCELDALALAACVFQINTAVASFLRLVNSLGTPKDTLLLRQSLGVRIYDFTGGSHKTRLHIGQLVKETSAKLKQASETDQLTLTVTKKIADAKLAKDFHSILSDFQKAQRLAAERETSYAPINVLPSRYAAKELDTSASKSSEQFSLLLESKRREEVLLLDNEIVFNEAFIEEREQGIKEIQQQIGEVKEIFKDLAVLVHDQGAIIDDISSNIENSHVATVQATLQLGRASNMQRSNSSMTCLLLVIFGIILLIVVVVVVA